MTNDKRTLLNELLRSNKDLKNVLYFLVTAEMSQGSSSEDLKLIRELFNNSEQNVNCIVVPEVMTYVTATHNDDKRTLTFQRMSVNFQEHIVAGVNAIHPIVIINPQTVEDEESFLAGPCHGSMFYEMSSR
jgi:hypothetical protein